MQNVKRNFSASKTMAGAWEIFARSRLLAVLSSVADFMFFLGVVFVTFQIFARIMEHLNVLMAALSPYLAFAPDKLAKIAEMSGLQEHLRAIAVLVFLWIGLIYLIWCITQSVCWLLAFLACKQRRQTARYIVFFFGTSIVWVFSFLALSYFAIKLNFSLIGIGINAVRTVPNLVLAAVGLFLSYIMSVSFAGGNVGSSIKLALAEVRHLSKIYAVCFFGLCAVLLAIVFVGVQSMWLSWIIFLGVLLPLCFLCRIAMISAVNELSASRTGLAEEKPKKTVPGKKHG